MNNQTISCKCHCHHEHKVTGCHGPVWSCEHCETEINVGLKPEKSEWEDLSKKVQELPINEIEGVAVTDQPILQALLDCLNYDTIQQSVTRISTLVKSEKKKSALEALGKVNNGRQGVILESGHWHEVVFGVHLNEVKEEYDK